MQTLSTLALALGLSTGVAAAWAADTAALQQAKAQARLLSQQHAPGAQAVDTQAPVITAFNAGKRVDVRKAGERLPIDITVTDNNSGVAYVYVEARGPSGQQQYIYKYLDFPLRTAVLPLGMDLGELSQAGAWQVTYVYAYDLAGNVATMGQSGLDTLGNTQFSVKNTVYDVTSPTLVSGRILTPSFSVSSPSPGVPAGGETQWAGVALAVSDGGGPDNAGVRTASLEFCQVSDYGYCYTSFSVLADNSTGRPGERNSRLVLGGLNGYYWGQPQPGTHAISAVYLTDFAGNSRSYRSILTGGETDFSTLFPSTTIEVLP